MPPKQIYVDNKNFLLSAAPINQMSIGLKKNSPNSKHRRISQNMVTAGGEFQVARCDRGVRSSSSHSILSGKDFRVERQPKTSIPPLARLCGIRSPRRKRVDHHAFPL